MALTGKKRKEKGKRASVVVVFNVREQENYLRSLALSVCLQMYLMNEGKQHFFLRCCNVPGFFNMCYFI